MSDMKGELESVRTSVKSSMQDIGTDYDTSAKIKMAMSILMLASIVEQMYAEQRRAANVADCLANGIMPALK